MNSKEIEITILIAFIFFALILFNFRNRIKEKNAYHISMAIITLIVMFIIIHLFFCYQLGLPASVVQDNSTDLTLSASDWLGFLGGYLGFSGSLIMAYLVYRQNKTINNLTLSEYVPSVSLIVQKSVNSTEFKDNDKFSLRDISQNIPGNKNEMYYSYHCACPRNDIEYEAYSILIFVKIINESKAPICNLSFKSLEIEELMDKNNHFMFVNRGNEWDPSDGSTDILPGRMLKRCFLIERVPQEIKTSWMTFNFSYEENIPFKCRILVSKTQGSSLFLLNVSEQIE